MKYLFILGRNIELSKAEIFSYFEHKNKILNYYINKNAILCDFEKVLDKEIIDRFGGVIAIGKVLDKEIIDRFGGVIAIGKVLDEELNLDKIEIYTGTKNKINYVLWNFADDFGKDRISKYLKQRFKQEKLKASEKNLTGRIEMQEEKNVENLCSNLIDEQYFIFKENSKYFFGKIIEKCDYSKIEKRDMNKPVRRQELSISPRLAKIMINLSQVQKNEILLDCFCGIGTILQEALLQKIKVIGTDNDEKAIQGAKQNLKWFKFNEKDYQLIKGNSSIINIPQINGVVTEPDFGNILKKIPNEEIVKKMLDKYENLMISVLNNLKSKIQGRIVFTAPFIKTMKSRKGCNIENILKKTKLKLVLGPFPEFRKNQIVGREIFVLSK